MDAKKIAVVDDAHCDPHNILFGVRRSIRYHNRRRQFFDLLDRTAKILGVLGGTATFTALLTSASHFITSICAVILAVASTFDLVIGSAQASRLHFDLARRFIALEQEITLEDRVTKARLNQLCAKRLEIEADEPPILRVLDTLCHNELLRAMGYGKAQFIKVGWIQRFFANITDISADSLVPDEPKICEIEQSKSEEKPD